MNITPFVHNQAPELCFFTLNGIRFTEKPGLGKSVDWYKVMTNKKALHPIAEIRAKHFKPVKACKIAIIDVIYHGSDNQWLNKTYRGVLTSYSDLMQQIKEKLYIKHPTLNHNKKVGLFGGSVMPLCDYKITTKQTYLSE